MLDALALHKQKSGLSCCPRGPWYGLCAYLTRLLLRVSLTLPQLSSLPLQIVIFFGWWYDVFYWIVEFLVFLHKGA